MINMIEKNVLSKNFFTEDYFGDKSLIKYIKNYISGHKKSNYFNYESLADNKRFWGSVFKIIKKYKIKGNFLDAACAYGLLLKYASPYFDKTFGFDISEFAIEKAKKNAPNAELSIADLNADDLPFDECFDLITALEVLEHTESVEASLRKLAMKLKNDGYMVISLPMRGTFWGKVFQLVDIDKSHVSVPKSEKEILKIIDRTGLRIIEKNYLISTPLGDIPGIAVSMQLVLRKKTCP